MGINPAHVHLLLNHLPVVGSIFALFLLMMGVIRRSSELQRAALAAFVLVALLAIPTFLTGEPAEKLVTNLAGVSKGLIETHEEAAEVSLWVIEAVGVFALAGLLLYRRATTFPRWYTASSLVLALAVGMLMAWTANLGGQIRHSEIAGSSPVVAHEHEHDHGD
jgi:uncharacterized membrane protein